MPIKLLFSARSTDEVRHHGGTVMNLVSRRWEGSATADVLSYPYVCRFVTR